MTQTSLYWILLASVFSGVNPGRTAAQEGSNAAVIEQRKTFGPVTVELELAPKRPVIGDVLHLQIRVIARKDVEVFMPEFGEALSRFQIIDFSPKENLTADGDQVFLQKYKLQSPPSGQHAIPPILIEYVDRRSGEQETPEGLDAYELFTERLNFEVQSVIVDKASIDLNPPLGRIEPRVEQEDRSFSVWVYVLIGLAAFAGGGGLALLIAKSRNRTVRKSAYEIAKKELDHLTSGPLPQLEEIDLFYVKITSIIRSYLENRFDLRAPELTTEEFLSTVSDSAELTADHNTLLNNFLKHADLVKFAGIQPTDADVRGMIEKANRFLEETRQNSPTLVDPDGLKGVPKMAHTESARSKIDQIHSKESDRA